MSTVKIINLTGRMKTFRLPHQKVCVKLGRCICDRGRGSSSLRIPAHGTAKDQPAAVIFAPDIQDALTSKPPKIKIVDTKPAPKAEKKGPAPETSAKGSTDSDEGAKPSTSGKGKVKKSQVK